MITLTNGTWTGNVTVHAVETGVVLTADDGAGLRRGHLDARAARGDCGLAPATLLARRLQKCLPTLPTDLLTPGELADALFEAAT